MKSLPLKQILPVIQGRIVIGEASNLSINRVVKKPNEVSNNTLLFHFKKWPIDVNLHKFNSSIIIVTDTPNEVAKHFNKNITIVKVPNINKAYWDFVQYYRGLFKIPVIGVTGTVGKTTVTEMLKTILSVKYKVQSTYDGRNVLMLNLKYLLGIEDNTEVAVFEMGVANPGNMLNHCKHFQPQIGVLLNIDKYHLRGCKTFDNYIREKATLPLCLSPGGTLIINSDDSNIKKINLAGFNGSIIYFGTNNNAHFQALNISYTETGMSFILKHQNAKYGVKVQGFGEHMVYNALAAIAASHAVNIDINKAIELLATFKPVRSHLQFRKGIKGCNLIDDTWNCNPPSMKSSLRVLKAMANSRKTVAVLGPMPNLGVAGFSEYSRIGELVVETGVTTLITIGNEAKRIADRALKLGFNKENLYTLPSAKNLYSTVLPFLRQDTLVLLKFINHVIKDPELVKFMKKVCPK